MKYAVIFTSCISNFNFYLKTYFFPRIFSFFAGTNGSTTSNDSEISEREKLLQNLDFCVDRISDIFNLRQIVEEYEDHFFEEKRQVTFSSTLNVRIFRTNYDFLVTFWLCQKIRTKNSRV